MAEDNKPKDTLSIQDDKSIEILGYTAAADWFQTDPKDTGLVRFYFRDQEGLLSGGAYQQEDFLRAVDFYCKNRDSETNVALALHDSQGQVRVFHPDHPFEVVVARIPASKLSQILEFAFQLARSDQKK